MDLSFQKSLKPFRCQRTKVSGLTMTRDLRQWPQIRESKTQKSRSALRIFSRLFTRFITANCWRSARFSTARFEVILNFDQTNKTKCPNVFIMILDWQAHANLSMISESTNNCEGQVRNVSQKVRQLSFSPRMVFDYLRISRNTHSCSVG